MTGDPEQRTYRRCRRAGFSCLLAILVLLSQAQAAGGAAGVPAPMAPLPLATEPPSQPRALANTTFTALSWELSISTLALVGGTLAGGAPAETCSWCSTNAFDRRVREVFVSDNPRAAATFSHVLSFGMAPAMAFGLTALPAIQSGHGRYAIQDAVIIVSAVAWTTGITQFAKTTFNRQRPAFHYARGGETDTEWDKGSSQENLSFFSGDTSLAFSLIASSATVAYLRSYPSAPFLAWVGGGMAALTGALRMAADVHWATDVLAGAAVGTGVGVALPLLFHAPMASNGMRLGILPLRAGGGLAVTWNPQ